MNQIHTTVAGVALAMSMPVFAQETAPKLGDHPAIVVQRLHAKQGYDYASKFYPHPAWLYLLPEEPHRMNEHPAVLVLKREQLREQVRVPALATAPKIAPTSAHE